MNTYHLLSGILLILLGLAHSILGEYLIFKSRRKKGSLVPTHGNSGLKQRHLRIIWATWHLASVFGWGLGALLIRVSQESSVLNNGQNHFLSWVVCCTVFTASLLVALATKGKHPGWIVLLLIGLLLVIGNY